MNKREQITLVVSSWSFGVLFGVALSQDSLFGAICLGGACLLGFIPTLSMKGDI
jgi:hypothetical protein